MRYEIAADKRAMQAPLEEVGIENFRRKKNS